MLGPLLALITIGAVETLYDLGIPIISPKVVLLLPLVYTAATASSRATIVAGTAALAYAVRHTYLGRSEYISAVRAFTADDVSRVFVFGVAVAGLVAIARYRERQRADATRLENAYLSALEANRAKSEFLAVISHELRTPLTTIMQYADLLNAGVAGPLEKDQREMLRRIDDGAVHLRDMIQQLLDYAQIEAGRMRLRHEDTDLVQLVRTSAAMLETAIQAKGLELVLDLPTAPLVVTTDAGKLRQVLLNLIENAVKFTDTGTITMRLASTEDGAILSVEDTGIGMNERELEAIFEPFWQSEAALTRQRGGFGLGLAISKQICALLAARLEVESAEGRGSTFRLRIPSRLPEPMLGGSANGNEDTAPANPNRGPAPTQATRIWRRRPRA